MSIQVELTYEERLLLQNLAREKLFDWDRIPERVLVNTGLAERTHPLGLLAITDAGLAALAQLTTGAKQ